MKDDNSKYIIALVLFVGLFVGLYFWVKYKKATEQTTTVGANSGTPSATQGTIAANTIAGTVTDKYFEYGSGKIYFADRAPSSYKTAELLSFTPDMATRSAFKSLN